MLSTPRADPYIEGRAQTADQEHQYKHIADVRACRRTVHPVDRAHNGDPDLINTDKGGHVIGDPVVAWLAGPVQTHPETRMVIHQDEATLFG
jgi:hypothetical protein